MDCSCSDVDGQEVELSEHPQGLDGATRALAALAQGMLLDTFRLLVCYELDGLAAGEITCQLEVPQNIIFAYLGALAQTGLVRSERRSRSVTYRFELDRLRELMLLLVHDCYGGRTKLYEPLIGSLAPTVLPLLRAQSVTHTAEVKPRRALSAHRASCLSYNAQLKWKIFAARLQRRGSCVI